MFQIKTWYLLISACALYWAVAIFNLTPHYWDHGSDSSQYIILAESLAKHSGYRIVNLPQEPAAVLPPLLPLILSPIIYFLGRDFIVMKTVMLLLSFLALILWHQLFSRYTTHKTALVAVVWLALGRLFFCYSFLILTEIPFLMLEAAALLTLERYKENNNVQNLFLLVGALNLVFFCRYIGIIFFLIAIIYILSGCVDDKYRKIGFLTVFCIPFIGAWTFFIHTCSHTDNKFLGEFMATNIYKPQSGLLTDHLSFIWQRLMGNVIFYWRIACETFALPWIGIFYTLDLVMFCAFATGVFKTVKENRYLLLIFSLVYTILLLFWPAHEDGRYFLPLSPVVVFYLIVGIKSIYEQTKILKIVIVAALIVIAVTKIFYAAQAKVYNDNPPEMIKRFFAVNIWAGKNLPKEGIIMSRKSRVTYLYTGHKSVDYPFATNAKTIWDAIEKYRVKYLITDESDAAFYYGQLINQYRDRFKLLYNRRFSAVFEVLGR